VKGNLLRKLPEETIQLTDPRTLQRSVTPRPKGEDALPDRKNTLPNREKPAFFIKTFKIFLGLRLLFYSFY
jgi:hypothetical protein